MWFRSKIYRIVPKCANIYAGATQNNQTSVTKLKYCYWTLGPEVGTCVEKVGRYFWTFGFLLVWMWVRNLEEKFAGPLVRAFQIIHFVLLTFQICETSAMQASSNSIFEHKARTRATFAEICAQILVSCLRLSGALGRTTIHHHFDLGKLCLLISRHPFSSNV